jgi:hypothetical protein
MLKRIWRVQEIEPGKPENKSERVEMSEDKHPEQKWKFSSKQHQKERI